jgi:hypothetical protein
LNFVKINLIKISARLHMTAHLSVLALHRQRTLSPCACPDRIKAASYVTGVTRWIGNQNQQQALLNFKIEINVLQIMYQ